MESSIKTPLGNIALRQARDTDLQAFRDLRLEALHNHPEAFGSDYATNLEMPLERWEKRLTSLGSRDMIYFADHQQRLIGMCGIFLGDSVKMKHSATIWGVYVQAEYRGLHIAEALIENCIEWARIQGVKVVKLGVVTTNTTAIRCYARCNFTVFGIEPQVIFHDGVMYDELLMVRML